MSAIQLTQSAPHAVYIHIPFCTNKCYYCDFNSYVLKDQPVMRYLQALEREMERTAAELPPGRIDTVFVGGGTPTVLTPEQMQFFLSTVRAFFPVHEQTEFSMEANPGTTDGEKLHAMKEGGVNRLSFGVQSFDNGLLRAIGRIHNTDDVYRSIELARKAGFANMSVDLMFGLPGQTLDMLQDSLAAALKLDLQHYSIYGLKVEENTLFHVLYEKNELPLPEEEEEARMYELIMDTLRAHGYRQYEISNFALPGFESRHNTTYWRNESYYGLGAGAHGYMRGARHINIKGVQPYINACEAGLPRLDVSEVPPEEAMEDHMMVGLRLLEGVSRDSFARRFGIPMESRFGGVLDSLVARGLLERTPAHYRLTGPAILLGNEVFGAFIGAGGGHS